MWSLIEKLIPPPYKAYAKLIKLGLIIILISIWSAFFYFKGSSANEDKWQAKIADIKESEYKKGIESVKITEKVVTVYKDRVITINKEVVKYVDRIQEAVPDNYNFDLPSGLVGLLDDAVQNEFSETSGNAHEGTSEAKDPVPSGVDLREASKVILENYGICYANAAQLESLQTWVKEQETLYNKPKRKWLFFKAD